MTTIIYIILGLVGLFVLLQVGLRLSVYLKKGKSAPELSGKYAKAASDPAPALFYFYSEQCGACKPMTPVVEKLKKEYRNVFKVNIQKDMKTAKKFGVMGTPSTVIVQNGEIKQFWMGPQPEDKLRKHLNASAAMQTA